jgi:hypothetical protein
MYFNDLLLKKGIDPRQVLVLRHRPSEPKLNRVFPRVAAERPDIFNAYQQTQTIRVEGAMKRARFVASFIGHEPRKACLLVCTQFPGQSLSRTRNTGRYRPISRCEKSTA